eukprot:CAMPEP_0174752476 /NCGR_PEP_ID=MMETSP1094-20130205/102135_1 /TAXON_ID=156173 /ORGANISM="Chrysochromulina brevifilum, Strain UTEX LB 985" /LENGTH=52 /DNA_ID=CAMNT_0015958125 /DNA_START=101 /DNA_END=254 /DNA_ORIENTATION=-
MGLEATALQSSEQEGAARELNRDAYRVQQLPPRRAHVVPLDRVQLTLMPEAA